MFDVNSGTLVLGVLNGLPIGLLAVGLVLVYKANRFLNLAHAQMGALGALLLAKFVLEWGWSWWLAFAVTIAFGVVTGQLIERLFVRPMRARTSSPLTLMLLTVGVSQLLLALTYVPALGPSESLRQSLYPQPFVSDLRVGGVLLTGTSILTMVLTPALALGLAAFLRFSMLGKTIRAAASNPDAARLCGISISQVSMATWTLAGGLSAVSAVLQAPSQPSFNAASLGPHLLMLTLGAAALGAFVSFWAALGGGLLLGVVSQVVASETQQSAKAQLAVFAVILVIILVRGRAISKVFASSGAASPERRPVSVPPAFQSSVLVRHQTLCLALPALFLAVVVPLLPYFRTEDRRFLLVLIVVYAIVGVALTMLVGWSGQVSLGHFALVGIGAFITARLVPHGWTLPSLLLLGGCAGALAMVLVGLPALRVRGLTLAVSSLGLAVVAPDWLFRQSWFGSAHGLSTPVEAPAFASGLGAPRTQLAVYYTAIVVLAAALASAAALRHSVPGRLVVAVRDNERASAAFGITPATVKLAILATSGFFAGAAGILWAATWRSVSATQFGPDLSVAVIALPVIGGLGSLSGAVAAAVVLYFPAFFLLGPLVSSLFGSFGQNLGFRLFLSGAGLVGTMLAYPTGIAGGAQRAWELLLARRARPAAGQSHDHLPLLVADVRVRFGGVVALDDATIEVRPGEIVGLIGPNGAGKTTLMNVISGALEPAAGSVQAFGHEVVDLPPDVRAGFGLARSFQDAALFPGLTVTDTLQVALARTHRVGFLSSLLAAPWARATERDTRRRAFEILNQLGLDAWADTPTSDLSTGARRICDLAAQVAAAPKLLLLDEPTAGVAQRDAEAFGPLLKRIRDELDCAILIIEHDMPLLMGVCDRVYAMDGGRVIAEGKPADIRSDSAVVASYLGTDPRAITRSGSQHDHHAVVLAPTDRAARSRPLQAATKRPGSKRTANGDANASEETT